MCLLDFLMWGDNVGISDILVSIAAHTSGTEVTGGNSNEAVLTAEG